MMVWGSLLEGDMDCSLCGLAALWFIPARAGNANVHAASACLCSVYPRSRGEHYSRSSLISLKRGLSPLARGTRNSHIAACIWFRFIPARAGNTCRFPLSVAPQTVYPRSRGEHTITFYNSVFGYGLSPLARGTHGAARTSSSNLRFIPARAGNTLPGCIN